ncbi:MAG: hypothetical protein KF784_09340 [Fimbriimonadaceae bacterium]|nr:hypothetical protein [Fimbriimonadaceae bacterium]
MEMASIASLDMLTGTISGEGIVLGERTVGQMQGAFADEAARLAMNPQTVVYRTYGTTTDDNSDQMLYATTVLMPGKVGSEYFMTRGHFHQKPQRGEFCLTLQGEGCLFLMDRGANTRIEPMVPGAIQNIDGALAHRVANIGDVPLIFLVTWLADCGHDYESIERDGFSLRRVEELGKVVEIPGSLRPIALFKSEDEIHELIRRFEECELSHEQWTHSAHVSSAAYFCFNLPPAQALEAFRERIMNLNDSHGVVQTIDRGYHETLTRFWMAYVRRWIHAARPSSLIDAVNGATEACRERYLVRLFYSKDRIMTWEARKGWISPDLATFAELDELAE